MERYNPDYRTGLTVEQVNNRIRDNLVNYNDQPPTKSIKHIIASNFFTYFNFMGSYIRYLFMDVLKEKGTVRLLKFHLRATFNPLTVPNSFLHYEQVTIGLHSKRNKCLKDI